MFDMGWSELLVIGVVALIVVGPKDLPILFRRVGQFVGKAKGMAREFSSAMNQAADESGMAEVKKSLQAAANPVQTGLDSVKSAATDFAKYDPETNSFSPVLRELSQVFNRPQDPPSRTKCLVQRMIVAHLDTYESGRGLLQTQVFVPLTRLFCSRREYPRRYRGRSV